MRSRPACLASCAEGFRRMKLAGKDETSFFSTGTLCPRIVNSLCGSTVEAHFFSADVRCSRAVTRGGLCLVGKSCRHSPNCVETKTRALFYLPWPLLGL